MAFVEIRSAKTKKKKKKRKKECVLQKGNENKLKLNTLREPTVCFYFLMLWTNQTRNRGWHESVQPPAGRLVGTRSQDHIKPQTIANSVACPSKPKLLRGSSPQIGQLPQSGFQKNLDVQCRTEQMSDIGKGEVSRTNAEWEEQNIKGGARGTSTDLTKATIKSLMTQLGQHLEF